MDLEDISLRLLSGRGSTQIATIVEPLSYRSLDALFLNFRRFCNMAGRVEIGQNGQTLRRGVGDLGYSRSADFRRQVSDSLDEGELLKLFFYDRFMLFPRQIARVFFRPLDGNIVSVALDSNTKHLGYFIIDGSYKRARPRPLYAYIPEV